MFFHKANTEHSETESVILLQSTPDHIGILCKIMQWYTYPANSSIHALDEVFGA
jgi:hypothetical protein